jgi:hypothetical protein
MLLDGFYQLFLSLDIYRLIYSFDDNKILWPYWFDLKVIKSNLCLNSIMACASGFLLLELGL